VWVLHTLQQCGLLLCHGALPPLPPLALVFPLLSLTLSVSTSLAQLVVLPFLKRALPEAPPTWLMGSAPSCSRAVVEPQGSTSPLAPATETSPQTPCTGKQRALLYFTRWKFAQNGIRMKFNIVTSNLFSGESSVNKNWSKPDPEVQTNTTSFRVIYLKQFLILLTTGDLTSL